MTENNTERLVAGAEGVLSMVGTPIGNLGDLTPRAAQAFRDADVICCEDTRVTSKLLAYLGISKPLVRCDENVIARRAPELVDRLLAVSESPLPRMPVCRAFPIPARCWSTRLARRARVLKSCRARPRV